MESSEVSEDDLLVYDFNPNSLPLELLQAIGLATAASAQTEHVLGMLIGGLLNIDDVHTEALTAHMAIPLKDHVIRTLAELHAPDLEDLDLLDEMLDKAKTCFDARNLLVHNSFCIDPKTGNVMSLRARARGSLLVELKPVSIDEIKEQAAALYKIGMDLMEFVVSRGLPRRHRNVPLPAPVKRSEKARTERRIVRAEMRARKAK
jgi:hypothetical protein